MAYKLMVEQSRRAEREYYRTLDPFKYLEKVRYESIDGDDIPDFVEDMDFNLRTTSYRFNYPGEVMVIGSEKKRYFPLTG